MPTIRKRTIVTSSGVSGDGKFPLTGSQYEYLPFDSEIEFAVIARPQEAATAAPPAGIEASIYSGSDVLQQSDKITYKGPDRRDGPTDTMLGVNAASRRDDFMVSDVAGAGERIAAELILPAAGGSNAYEVETIVIITPA